MKRSLTLKDLNRCVGAIGREDEAMPPIFALTGTHATTTNDYSVPWNAHVVLAIEDVHRRRCSSASGENPVR